MFKFIKNKIDGLRKSYKTYRTQYDRYKKRIAAEKKRKIYEIESRKRIQIYADYITKQCAYEMKRYGHIHDGNLSSTFVGVIYNDWLSKVNDVIEEKENRIKKSFNEKAE